MSPRSWPAAAALTLVALLVVTAAAVEVSSPAVAVQAEPIAVDPPSSGTWYCPVTASAEETAVVSVAAATERESTVTLVRYPEGVATADEPVQVTADAPIEVTLTEAAAATPVSLRWNGGPVVASWRVEGQDTAGAPCAPDSSPQWHITGFDTSAQSASRLHLFNPFGVPAVAEVTFGTPTGPVALVLTDNITVQPGTSVALDLNEYEPEQLDLAVTVEVLAGRMVAQGSVTFAPTENQPGPRGRVVLQAVAEPAESSFVPEASSGEGLTSWLSVFNPGEREAAVELRVSDALPESPALLGETSVPAGGVARIEVAEASSSESFGVSVLGVNGVPVVVTRLTWTATDAGEGVSAGLGGQPSATWAAAGGRTADSSTALYLYNPLGEDVTVEVDAGAQTPAEWSGLALEPNERVSLPLADVGDLPAIGVRVRAGGPVVAGLASSSSGENPRYWTAGAVPGSVWEGQGTRPPLRRDPSLSTQPLPTATPESF